MAAMIEFLKNNAEWLFGGGGIAALLIALMKRGGGKASFGANISGGRVGGDIVGGNKSITTKQGFGALEVALILAMIVSVIGALLLFFMPEATNVMADNNATAIQGNGNNVNISREQ